MLKGPEKKNRRRKRGKPGLAPSARAVAFEALLRVEAQGEHADDLLRAGGMNALSEQDRDLATALTMGVLRWQILLDVRVRRYLARPDAKLDLPVRVALRLGALQLLRMDRIPDHAAIHESVALCRAAGHEHAARMVNAVLRRMAAELRELPDAASAKNAAELAERTAHPLWMVERWVSAFGQVQARLLCEYGQRQPECTLRVADEAAEEELVLAGCRMESAEVLKAARRVAAGDWRATAAWQSGRVRVQDEGSQLVAELAGRGERILDCCAAPGGKTMILAERNPGARVDACEISEVRAGAMTARLEAMSALPCTARISVHCADAVEWIAGRAESAWDLVVMDAPCSGTGTLGRNPEIRHRLRVEELARQAERQTALLRAAMRASSRRIVYATCSLEREENEDVVEAVLAGQAAWRRISLTGAIDALETDGRVTEMGAAWLRSGLLADGTLRMRTRDMPGTGLVRTDGFFVAMLERVM